MRRNSFFLNTDSLDLKNNIREEMKLLKQSLLFEIKKLLNENKLEINEIKTSIENLNIKFENFIHNNNNNNTTVYSNEKNNSHFKENNPTENNNNSSHIESNNSVEYESNLESEFIMEKSTNELTINKNDLINLENKASKIKIKITIKNSGKIKWPAEFEIKNDGYNDLFRIKYKHKKELEPGEELQIETNINFLNVNDLKAQNYELFLIIVDKDNKKIGNGYLVISLNIKTNKNIDMTESESKNFKNWKSSTIKNNNKEVSFNDEIKYNNNFYNINNSNNNKNIKKEILSDKFSNNQKFIIN